MKLPWNVAIMILHTLTTPGASALMALTPLLSLAGGMLASLRRIGRS